MSETFGVLNNGSVSVDNIGMILIAWYLEPFKIPEKLLMDDLYIFGAKILLKFVLGVNFWL